MLAGLQKTEKSMYVYSLRLRHVRTLDMSLVKLSYF